MIVVSKKGLYTRMKCFSIDLDGTLLNSSHQIPEENFKVLQDLQAQGHTITILIQAVPLKMLLNLKRYRNYKLRSLVLMGLLFTQVHKKYYMKHPYLLKPTKRSCRFYKILDYG